MHRRWILLIALFFSIHASVAYAAERQIAFTVSDGDTTGTIYVGLDPTATNGIDASLGETLQPPKPPDGAFDARWVGGEIGLSLGDGILKDYRTGTSTSSLVTVHELQYQVGVGSTITIGWNLPADVTARLQDFETGYSVNVYLSGTGSFVVTNPGVRSKLKLTMHYKPLLLGLKVFLQGPYNAGQARMNIWLKTMGYLVSHFGSMPIPGWAVDSINVEIRNAESGSGSTTRRFRPAWLLADGTIRDFRDTTVSFVALDSALADNYFIVVRQRNHLGAESATSVALSSSVVTYDFSTSTSKFRGNEAKQLASGVYGLFGGDASGDGFVVLATELSKVRPDNLKSGYRPTDLNMDGFVVLATELLVIRPNNLKSTKISN
jgi:hypothetical protein